MSTVFLFSSNFQSHIYINIFIIYYLNNFILFICSSYGPGSLYFKQSIFVVVEWMNGPTIIDINFYFDIVLIH